LKMSVIMTESIKAFILSRNDGTVLTSVSLDSDINEPLLSSFISALWILGSKSVGNFSELCLKGNSNYNLVIVSNTIWFWPCFWNQLLTITIILRMIYSPSWPIYIENFVIQEILTPRENYIKNYTSSVNGKKLINYFGRISHNKWKSQKRVKKKYKN